jgi:hypothetical protein
MPKHFREERIPIDQIQSDPSRVYEPMVEAYMAYYSGQTAGRTVTVLASKIRVAEAFRAPLEHIAMMRPGFTEVRRTNEEHLRELFVLEREDGSIWSYDDTALVALYQELAPGARVLCRIIGTDPAQGD